MWILVFILTILLLFAANRVKAPFHPNKIFALYWGVQLFVFILFRRAFIMQPDGIFYILIGSFCVLFGGGVIRTKAYSIEINDISTKVFSKDDQRRFLLLIVFVWMFAMYSSIKALMTKGIDLLSLIDFDTLLETNYEMSKDRYSQSESHSSLSQALLVFSYLSPLLGGFYVRLLSSPKDKLCFLTLLPGVMGALTQGVKMGIIVSVMLFLVGIIVASLVYHLPMRVRPKYILFIILGLVAFLGILILSMMFRIGRFDPVTFEIVSSKFVSYAFGHVPAFTQVFDSYWHFDFYEHTLGGKSFLGITHYLGLLEREQGLYSEMLVITKAGQDTNVFTIFRIILDDFGIFFGLIWLVLIGAVNNICYRNVVKGNHIAISATILAVTLFVIMWSFVTCALVYTSYVVMFVLYYFVIRYTVRRPVYKNIE